jgi:hypothetical protein
MMHVLCGNNGDDSLGFDVMDDQVSARDCHHQHQQPNPVTGDKNEQ